MTQDSLTLDDLRRGIDRIDDAIHDLLMERTQLVEKIGAVKGKEGGVILRPGREADILRRLLARHSGPFPKLSLIRIWRELMGALVGLQGPFSVGVFMPERGAGYLEIARDQFGAHAHCLPFRTVGQVARAVADGQVTVGVVPVPDQENGEAWWTTLMGDSPDLPRIVARLPFSGPAPSRDNIEALVLARMPQDATGRDRTWLGVETEPDISRARLLTALSGAGLEVNAVAATHASGGHALHLVEINGYVAPDDQRLPGLRGNPFLRVTALGGYAIPFTAEDMAV